MDGLDTNAQEWWLTLTFRLIILKVAGVMVNIVLCSSVSFAVLDEFRILVDSVAVTWWWFGIINMEWVDKDLDLTKTARRLQQLVFWVWVLRH